MRITKYLVGTLALAVLACNPPEDGPALEEGAYAAEETFLPGAPAPAVRRAVKEAALQVSQGEATFYADHLDRQRTASGELLDQNAMVAAHRAFPFGTRLRVTNVRNDRQVKVRVVDRGPFAPGPRGDAILDLSRAAAEQLDFIDAGRARVRVEVMSWGDGVPAT